MNKLKKIFNRFHCVYCGEPSDTRDHVVPVSYNVASRKGATTTEKNTVPCCRQCNSTLGDQLFLSIGDRSSYLYSYYKKKYKKIINIPDWTTDDLCLIENGSLKKSIKVSLKFKSDIKKRLKHLNMVSLIYPEIKEVWNVIHNIEDDDINRNQRIKILPQKQTFVNGVGWVNY